MHDFFAVRIAIVSVLIALVALILGGKLVSVQLLHGEQFSEKADRQYVSPTTTTFDRGVVFFQQKDGTRLSAATQKSGYTLALNPMVIGEHLENYLKITKIVPTIDRDDFLDRARKQDDPYEEVARQLTREQADAIQALDIDGVSLHKERWRFYPQGRLAANIVGFVGYKGDAYGGRYGVERYYDDVLQRGEEDLYVNFFAEVFANIEQSLFYSSSKEGDVVLSIEPEVQRFLEGQLDNIMEGHASALAGGIVIDPRTGAIAAMGVRPTFDPNAFEEEERYAVFLNPLVESIYEMGSIIKPLTVAAGLDAGVITPESTYNDTGSVRLNASTIRNYDGKARGVVSMQEVLNQSLNTGVVHIMQQMGRERLAEYFRNLGFGQETGIDLPSEVPGLVANLESSREIEYATASFGQGIAMTPISTVRALSALANNGVLVTPHVGDRIDYSLGRSKAIAYDDDGRVFAASTVEDISRMLVEVVDTSLLDGTVKLPHYSIAAKTGTAQMAKEEGGGYYDDKFLHSFFGYFPAYDPEFLVFLFTIDPKGVRYASQTLTHPFINTAKFLIHYYTIPPDR